MQMAEDIAGCLGCLHVATCSNRRENMCACTCLCMSLYGCIYVCICVSNFYTYLYVCMLYV